jgi:hypothetical protein
MTSAYTEETFDLYQREFGMIKLVTNKASVLFRALSRTLELVGRARAADKLSSMGYHAEARELMNGYRRIP